jgi:hypothetical protein
MNTPHTSVEDRLRAVEDTLAIYHLIAVTHRHRHRHRPLLS